jgi:hypothetical protein
MLLEVFPNVFFRLTILILDTFGLTTLENCSPPNILMIDDRPSMIYYDRK